MKKHFAGLTEASAENKLVILCRKPIDDDRLHGYVVGLSDTWVLLHFVKSSMLMLDGYKAVRLADVSHFSVDDTFIAEYMRLRGIQSKSLPDMDVSNLSALLSGVSASFPLFMIERERVEPGIGIVGRSEKMTRRNFWMNKFSAKAKWIGIEKFKLKDITAINFGDHYHEALAFMDAHYKRTEIDQ